MTLSFVITYSTGIIDQGIDRWTRHEDQITLLCQDWNSKCYFQVIRLEGVIYTKNGVNSCLCIYTKVSVNLHIRKC